MEGETQGWAASLGKQIGPEGVIETEENVQYGFDVHQDPNYWDGLGKQGFWTAFLRRHDFLQRTTPQRNGKSQRNLDDLADWTAQVDGDGDILTRIAGQKNIWGEKGGGYKEHEPLTSNQSNERGNMWICNRGAQDD